MPDVLIVRNLPFEVKENVYDSLDLSDQSGMFEVCSLMSKCDVSVVLQVVVGVV